MALATTSGRGFIISDLDFKFLPSGQAVVNFPVAFNRSKKNEQTGEWDRTHEIVYRAAAFGALAEFIQNNYGAKTEIDLTFEAFQRKYTTKEGEERVSLDAIVTQVAAPFKRDGGGGQSNAPRTRAVANEGGY